MCYFQKNFVCYFCQLPDHRIFIPNHSVNSCNSREAINSKHCFHSLKSSQSQNSLTAFHRSPAALIFVTQTNSIQEVFAFCPHQTSLCAEGILCVEYSARQHKHIFMNRLNIAQNNEKKQNQSKCSSAGKGLKLVMEYHKAKQDIHVNMMMQTHVSQHEKMFMT